MIAELILRERQKKRQRTLCILAVFTVVTCYLLFQVIFGISIVEGTSMEPGIPEGSLVIYNRLVKSYEENDIVIVQMEGTSILKRIDTIEEDRVYLLGDNLSESVDSRTFGWAEMEQIRGKVICVIRLL